LQRSSTALEEATAQVSVAEEEVARLRVELAEAKAASEASKQQVAEAESEVGRLKSELKAKDEQINEQDSSFEKVGTYQVICARRDYYCNVTF